MIRLITKLIRDWCIFFALFPFIDGSEDACGQRGSSGSLPLRGLKSRDTGGGRLQAILEAFGLLLLLLLRCSSGRL